jgi:hypothetical protein
MPEDPRTVRQATRFIESVDRALEVLEELKKSRAALRREAARPPLQLVATAQQEESPDEE